MILRQTYLDRVIPLIDKNLIKVFTGVRRSGKTVLLSQIRNHILTLGKTKEQIVYISFESMRNRRFKDANLLYEHLTTLVGSLEEKIYFFFDEIQMVDRWEEVVSSLMVDYDCDIYITGSNSKLLSGELATLIAGRYIHIDVYPFSLSEAKELAVQNGKFTSNEELFQQYLKFGGLPMRFALDDTSIEPYLSDTYDAIIIKDILQRNKIKDQKLLSTLLDFLLDNVANPFSARSIVSALATEGVKVNVETVLNYIDYIKSAMILSVAKRYDLKGKKILTTNEKYYAMDLGLRNIRKNSNDIDYNKLYENVVYLELLYRGYDVRVGKFNDYEIDFVAYKGNDIEYFQVCYALSEEKTIEREFGNLEKIKDNYPKTVISGDLPDFSRNGINHFNIIDFLLNKH